jgi:hypothetical protein
MKRVVIILACVIGVPLLLLIGCIGMEQIPMSRARPPKSVTDVSSCLAWLKKPMGSYRVTVGNAVYYQVTGPAGRFAASGPSAYTFDAQGRFIGWSSDMGDFKRPAEVFQEGAKRERIPLEQLPKKL